jgi:hypothetical protein
MFGLVVGDFLFVFGIWTDSDITESPNLTVEDLLAEIDLRWQKAWM